METLVHVQDIDAPADVVWRIVADHARDTEWRGDVLRMSSDPTGLAEVGTRTREAVRVGGRTHRNEGVVETVEPGRSFSWRTTHGVDARGSRTVTPLAGGRCEVTLELYTDPRGLDRLIAPMVRTRLARTTARDLRALAALATEAAVPAR